VPDVRVHVFVTGYVQGVFYRHSTAQRARARGLTGWVRNLRDGRVELVAEGDQAAVEDLIGWCHSGPPHATVEQVEVSWEQATGEFDGFFAE
jgi:acylphosphatase